MGVDCRSLGRLRINRRPEFNGGEVVVVARSEPSMATAGFRLEMPPEWDGFG